MAPLLHTATRQFPVVLLPECPQASPGSASVRLSGAKLKQAIICFFYFLLIFFTDFELFLKAFMSPDKVTPSQRQTMSFEKRNNRHTSSFSFSLMHFAFSFHAGCIHGKLQFRHKLLGLKPFVGILMHCSGGCSCTLCDISSDFFIISGRFEAAHEAEASLGLCAAPGRVNRRAAFKAKHIRRPLLAYFRFADGAPLLLRGCRDFLRTQTA